MPVLVLVVVLLVVVGREHVMWREGAGRLFEEWKANLEMGREDLLVVVVKEKEGLMKMAVEAEEAAIIEKRLLLFCAL